MSITIKLRRPIKHDPVMTEERARELYVKLNPFLKKTTHNCNEGLFYEIYGRWFDVIWSGENKDPANKLTFEEFLQYYKIILISRGDHAA